MLSIYIVHTSYILLYMFFLKTFNLEKAPCLKKYSYTGCPKKCTNRTKSKLSAMLNFTMDMT